MATLINEAELKEKCEKATEYGLKRSGRIRFKTKPQTTQSIIVLLSSIKVVIEPMEWKRLISGTTWI